MKQKMHPKDTKIGKIFMVNSIVLLVKELLTIL